MKKKLFVFLTFILVSITFAQDTYYVSLSGTDTPPYETVENGANNIQSAVDAASDGDLILVDDGTYILTTNISVIKGITIQSINGNSAVTIDGNNVTRCFYIDNADAVIDGLSIINGYNPSELNGGFGGGANIYDGGTIQNCIITNCQARDGAGVAIQNDGLVLNSIITNNNADNNSGSGYGGGVRMLNGGTTRGCLVYSNTSVNYGGGINIWNAGTIQNCTIVNNTAPNGAGVRARNNSLMENTISYFNNGLDVQLDGSGYFFYNNCTSDSHLLPGSGNISDNPLVENAASDDYHLSSTSTLIDAGLNAAWMTGVVDLDDYSRISGSTVDIGAYEFAGQTIISDDFSPETSLDANIWEFFDPIGDASLVLNGTNATISIPQATGSHDLGNNDAPRLLQSIDDIDFEVEVKFESVPNTKYQMQGIVVQTNTNAWIRFETYYDSEAMFFVKSYGVTSPISEVNTSISGGIPQYLRVLRSGDDWTFNYSFDGTNWNNVTTFTLAVPVNKVGFYGANHDPNPGFTVNADYFMNLASPITDTDSQAPIAPVVDVWYGNTQNFGQEGNPQTWVNILGSATDDISVSNLTYSLNGGASIPLTIGPDGKRLVGNGDFNIEIDRNTLLNGVNTVAITAIDGDAASTTKTVTLNYTAGNIWEMPYTTDWSSISNIEDVGQIAEVADGLWELTTGGIKTVETGYDRLIVVGDQTWETNYEVEVPITIHSNSNDAGIGFAVGWQGHTGSASPRIDWPLQAIGWVRYASGTPQLRILTYPTNVETSQPISITNGIAYILKARSEAIGNGESRFYVKIWEEGTTEPASWMIQSDFDSRNGSVLMITHKADVTWGNMTITSVSGNSAPVFTSSPITTVQEGELYTYNITASDLNAGDVLTITHPTLPSWLSYTDIGNGMATLTGTPTLSDVGVNNVELIVKDIAEAQDQQLFNISVTPVGQTSPISDDFYPEITEQTFWRFLDPVGDCSYLLTGTNLHINVAGLESHDAWSSGVNIARLLQPAPLGDFGVEAKFDSAPSVRYQMQGIVVQEDDDTILRFEVFHDGTSPKIFAAIVDAGLGTATQLISVTPSPAVVPSYLRVERAANLWTLSYSFDNISWIVAGSFTRVFVATEVGVYGGNQDLNQEFMVDVDYFMNMDFPIWDDISGPPTTPLLAYPANSAVGISIEPIFNWNVVSSAASYTLQLATDVAFTNNLVTYSGITETTFNATGLLNNTQYFWRVSAANDAGTSSFSAARTFTTTSAVIANLSWPIGGATVYTTSPTLNWWGASSTCDLLYSVYPDMSSATVINNINGTNYVISGLANGTIYYWQVRSRTSNGAISAYSIIESFKTIEGSNGNIVPIPSWPIGGAISYTNSPVLYWYLTEYSLGLEYEVEYSTGAFTGTPNITGITAMNTTLNGLASGTTYNWQVRSTNGVTPSSWSVQGSFTTVAAISNVIIPIPSWPVGNATVYTNSPILYWYLGASGTGLEYEIEYSSNVLTGNPTVTGITSTQYALNNLESGTTYNWQVRSTDGETTSAWSTKESFTTLGTNGAPVVPIPSWPVGDAAVYTISPTLYWYLNEYSAGLEYEIEYSIDALTGAPNVSGITSQNIILTGLTNGATYNWQVRSTNGVTNSEWSVQESFKITVGTIGAGIPVPSWPIGGAIVYTETPVLYWYLNSSSIGLEYQVLYSTSAVTNDGVLQNATETTAWLSNANVTLPQLAAGTTHYWQVRSRLAANNAIVSNYSAVASFVTEASFYAPVTVIPGSPNGNVTVQTDAPTLSWILPTTSESKLTFEMEISDNPEMSNSKTFKDLVNPFYTLSELNAGKKYYWRARSKNTDGKYSLYSDFGSFSVDDNITGVEDENLVPTKFVVEQNYPNPFNPSTTIKYGIPKAAYVTVTIYNMLGQEVRRLVQSEKDPGTYHAVWKGDNNSGNKVSSGTYIFNVVAGDMNVSKKMILLK